MKKILWLFLILSACQSTPDGIYPTIDVEPSYLEQIVRELSQNIGARNLDHYQSLQKSSRVIQKRLTDLGYQVKQQQYQADGKQVENIIVSIGPKDAERIVVGAHYDTFGDQRGADDNASGIAGLLTLAKLLKSHDDKLNKRVDLVAYTLEEPPYFRTQLMGSYIHAKSLADGGVSVRAMIALEMIGYFDDAKGSQSYPSSILKLFYPSTGNFIAVISNMGSRKLKSQVRDYMSLSTIPVRSLAAPASLVGVDFSDHQNYWQFGYDAVMVTDTAFYRNHNYHTTSDTIDTLDFKRMSEVVKGVYFAVLNLAR